MNISPSPKQLRAFVTVARTRSFVEASARLHLSQPALSVSIQKLEQVLGGSLLARTTRTLALTPEGETFLPVAERLLADWDTALENITNQFALKQGSIRLAAMPFYAGNRLPAVIHRFCQSHPGLRVQVDDVIAEAVVEAVSLGRVELGVSFAPEHADELRFEPLYTDRFIAIVPPDHRLAARRRVGAAELVESPLILLQRPSSMRRLIEQALLEAKLDWQVDFEAHQLATVGTMVATGLGVSIVPQLCQQQMEALGACCAELEVPVIEQRVGILSRTRYPLSVAAAAFKQALLEGE